MSYFSPPLIIFSLVPLIPALAQHPKTSYIRHYLKTFLLLIFLHKWRNYLLCENLTVLVCEKNMTAQYLYANIVLMCMQSLFPHSFFSVFFSLPFCDLFRIKKSFCKPVLWHLVKHMESFGVFELWLSHCVFAGGSSLRERSEKANTGHVSLL